MLTSEQFKQAMSQFCTGVVVVTGVDGSGPQGFCAQSFVSLSIDPPLIAICPAKTSTSWPRIRRSGVFAVNILGADQRPLAAQFSRSGGDKFRDLAWRSGSRGLPILADAIASIDCELYAEHEAGDHSIVVGRVLDLEVIDAARPPLLFFRSQYREILPALK